jgi:hypothetical protein
MAAKGMFSARIVTVTGFLLVKESLSEFLKLGVEIIVCLVVNDLFEEIHTVNSIISIYGLVMCVSLCMLSSNAGINDRIYKHLHRNMSTCL